MPSLRRSLTFSLFIGLACGDDTGNEASDSSAEGSESESTSQSSDAESGDETMADDSSSTDEGSEGTDEETGETGEGGCIELSSAQWTGIGEGVDAIFSMTVPQIGDPKVNDVVQIELYNDPPEVGVAIDLGSAPNDNYLTCSQCVRVLEDIVGVVTEKQYLQESGTITFTEIVGPGQWLGTIEDLTLIEVTVAGNFESTPVEGGGCITITGSMPFDTLPGG